MAAAYLGLRGLPIAWSHSRRLSRTVSYAAAILTHVVSDVRREVVVHIGLGSHGSLSLRLATLSDVRREVVVHIGLGSHGSLSLRLATFSLCFEDADE